MSSAWLNARRRNVTSQFGEDGVIEAIFERIGSTNQWCCEFGAWDGTHLSNTHNLVRNHGWSAVLIEADGGRYQDLVAFAAEAGGRVTPVHAMVGSKGDRRLDAILARTSIPREFDLLSVDVDNDDYLIWDALQDYRPRVVIIEVNSYLQPAAVKVPVEGFGGRPLRRGASLRSTVELGRRKGYSLALHTGNAIFVRDELAGRLDVEPDRWEELFDPSWVGQRDESRRAALRRVLGRPYRWMKRVRRQLTG